MVGEKVESIDAYIAGYPPEIQTTLQQLRRIIMESAPGATEKISWQMPAFALHGDLVYFAVCKNHIGFYPTPSGIDAFRQELAGYKGTKGSIHLPLDKPLPDELIRKIVQFRVAENERRAEEKSNKRK